MALSKDILLELYNQGLSVQEIANTLNQKKSTVYYWMRKYGISMRTRSEAQKTYVDRAGSHQRTGMKHGPESRGRITLGLREFWDSEDGSRYREGLSERLKKEWDKKSVSEKRTVINRLRLSKKPGPNE